MAIVIGRTGTRKTERMRKTLSRTWNVRKLMAMKSKIGMIKKYRENGIIFVRLKMCLSYGGSRARVNTRKKSE